uniref:Uncharacterized protein n=1 Tax=Steinernema glaseri TaxID=37863 RepID=A0A1I8AA18_9BILA
MCRLDITHLSPISHNALLLEVHLSPIDPSSRRPRCGRGEVADPCRRALCWSLLRRLPSCSRPWQAASVGRRRHRRPTNGRSSSLSPSSYRSTFDVFSAARSSSRSLHVAGAVLSRVLPAGRAGVAAASSPSQNVRHFLRHCRSQRQCRAAPTESSGAERRDRYVFACFHVFAAHGRSAIDSIDRFSRMAQEQSPLDARLEPKKKSRSRAFFPFRD